MIGSLRRQLNLLVDGSNLDSGVLVSPGLPDAFTGDRAVIERVFDNLITNAVKYTHAGRVDVQFAARDGFFVIEVSDTGPGLGASDTPPSARAGKSYGLGLSIVTRLLAKVGGHLGARSRAGIGSTFTAVFPLEPRPAIPIDRVLRPAVDPR